MIEYIKREDALKAMEWKWAGKAAFDAVKAIPSADVVERKKGKWVKGVSENGATTALFCSVCHYENKHWYEWNFCPNCGADMRERKDK